MHFLRFVVTFLVASLCLQGCTTYQSVTHTDEGGGDAHKVIGSSCAELAVELGRDVKVGDEIRYTTCDGQSAKMSVTALNPTTLIGEKGAINLSELRSIEIKKLSIGKTVLYGVAGGTVARKRAAN
ncbi:hypothetical protein, partial [Paraburkholderia caribensis]|uniref:hypothetical protein n=1 Tax=Paraburkholderia caribensis TaxID=75105 RepID=UPI001CC4388B